MDRCPIELWTRIIGLACTDGGTTGCAIALVSRYFREIVLPVQLHSVALGGMAKMRAFADLLEQREPAHRRVRHLFLSTTSRDRYATHAASRSYTDLDDVCLRIFTIIAPDLHTLATTVPKNSFSAYQVLFFSFPCLTELALHGSSLYLTTPSLRYLHILSSCDSIYMHTMGTPALTHLRMSAVSAVPLRLLQQLESFLAGSDQKNDSEVGSPPFPLTLQEIIIQRDAIRFTTTGEPLINGINWVHDQFRALKVADKNGKLEILGSDIPARNTRDDWEDRINGGCGCWCKGAV